MSDPQSNATGEAALVSLRYEDYVLPPPGRALPLARFISSVAAPPTLALLGLFLTAAALDSRRDWLWIAFYLAFAVVVPVFFLLWQLHTGRVSDFHLRVRTERYATMRLTIASSGLAWLVMYLGGAPQLLTTIALAAWAQAILLFAITLRWKISAHGAAAATLAVLGWKVSAPMVAMAFTALVPLVAWARIRLRRHTPWQVVMGSLLGSGVVALAFAL